MHLFRILWLCLAVGGSIGSNFESVYVKSPLKQLVTSNSLRWEYVKKPHDWVKDSRVVLLNGFAACKGTYKGVAVIGSARRSNGHCYVELNGSLHSLRTKFYILIQRIKASRLVWSPWNIFTKIPNSSVAFDPNTFVARSENEEDKGSFSFGSLDPKAGLSGEIVVFGLSGDRKLMSSTKGAILVEHEPVRYELKKVKYNQRRRKVLNETNVILGSKTFMNPGLYNPPGSWSSIVSVLSYNTSHSYNWGQIWGLITGLPSRGPPLTPPQEDFPIHDFEWGIALTLHKHMLLEVSRVLQAKTASHCIIKAKEISSEVPYTAELVSIYEDGSESSIWINGAYSETVHSNVEVVFDEPYFIKNGSVAPTTTTTTTTTSTTTTTATMSEDTSSDEVFKVKNPRHASKGYGQELPRGERYYSLTSSTTTKNPLYRFYPPEDEEPQKGLPRVILDPKTFSLRNSCGKGASSSSVLLLPILVLSSLLCYHNNIIRSDLHPH